MRHVSFCNGSKLATAPFRSGKFVGISNEQLVSLKRIEEFLQVVLDGIAADLEATADFLDDLEIRVAACEEFHDLRADEIEVEHVPVTHVEHDAAVPGVHVAGTWGKSDHAALYRFAGVDDSVSCNVPLLEPQLHKHP